MFIISPAIQNGCNINHPVIFHPFYAYLIPVNQRPRNRDYYREAQKSDNNLVASDDVIRERVAIKHAGNC